MIAIATVVADECLHTAQNDPGRRIRDVKQLK